MVTLALHVDKQETRLRVFCESVPKNAKNLGWIKLLNRHRIATKVSLLIKQKGAHLQQILL